MLRQIENVVNALNIKLTKKKNQIIKPDNLSGFIMILKSSYERTHF